MVNYTIWFLHVKPNLCSMDKQPNALQYYYFFIYTGIDFMIFVKDFCIHVHRGYCIYRFYFFIMCDHTPFAFQEYWGSGNDNQESKHLAKWTIQGTCWQIFHHILKFHADHMSPYICHCKISDLISKTPSGHVIISMISNDLALDIF